MTLAHAWVPMRLPTRQAGCVHLARLLRRTSALVFASSLVVVAVGTCETAEASTASNPRRRVPCRLDGSDVRKAFGRPISRLEHDGTATIWYLGTRLAIEYHPANPNIPSTVSRARSDFRRARTQQASRAARVGGVGDEAFFTSNSQTGSTLWFRSGSSIFNLGALSVLRGANGGAARAANAKPRLIKLAHTVLCDVA